MEVNWVAWIVNWDLVRCLDMDGFEVVLPPKVLTNVIIALLVLESLIARKVSHA